VALLVAWVTVPPVAGPTSLPAVASKIDAIVSYLSLGC
jgi:hypothetical protein